MWTTPRSEAGSGLDISEIFLPRLLNLDVIRWTAACNILHLEAIYAAASKVLMFRKNPCSSGMTTTVNSRLCPL